jgi:hypothetical protein
MQSSKPAESLLQRLLQSEKIRNHYVLLLEDEDGCTQISLCCTESTIQPQRFHERMNSSETRKFFVNEKDFFVGN